MIKFYLSIVLPIFIVSSSCCQNDTLPKLFAPGIISSGEFDSHPCFTPDGNTMYFVKSTPNFTYWTICISNKINGKWSQPQIAPFSGRYSDADPYITSDGQHFYFISTRPIRGTEEKDLDIWVMDKTKTGWSEPTNIGAPVNSKRNEWYPTISKMGTIYFGSEREGGKGACDLYKANRVDSSFTNVQSLGDSINTRFNEFEPFISEDERFLIYMGFAPSGFGGSDLFVSYNESGKWTKGKNLGEPFSSFGNEYSPLISHDKKYFFWASTVSRELNPFHKKIKVSEYQKLLNRPGNGLGDIYFVPMEYLKQKTKRLIF